MSTHQPAFNDELDEEYNLTIDNASNTSTASDDSIESDIEEDEYPELNCRDDDKEDEEEYEVYNIRDNPKMKIFDDLNNLQFRDFPKCLLKRAWPCLFM